MIARLSLSRRVGLIVIIAFIAGWLAVIAGGFFTIGPRLLPSPARLEAMADLIERMPAQERAAVAAVLVAPFLTLEVAPGPFAPAPWPQLRPADERVLAGYRQALSHRALAVVPLTRNRFISVLNAVEFRLGLASGEILIVTSTSPVFVAPFGVPAGLAAGLVGILIALVTLIMLHREFRPLSRLAAMVDRIEPSGEMVALAPLRARSPELRSLIAAFERLQGRIATLLRARMALVGGIQHDLRTFATRLRLRIDGIADAQTRARAVSDIEQMIALLDDALLASRAGVRALDEELVDLAALLAAEVSDRLASGAPVRLHVDPGDATVLGDRLALRRIFANLVENALEYGQRAEIVLRPGRADVAVAIDDAGPGIPHDRREILLEPFTRLETSRARKTGGAGLGLAVVNTLVAAHDGRVEIGNAPSGGARVRVLLPRFLA
ncbi:MAG: ATP-binding protein [Pseudomonadota bacterium]